VVTLGLLPEGIGVRKDQVMPFPPNYSQERRSREAAKQRKAREKQEKREEASAQRKREQENAPPQQARDKLES
jgi:hypothetical protein